MPNLDTIAQLIETVHRLRAPDGCPWDRVQTHQSLRQYLIEEAYEVLDVIDQIPDPSALKEDKTRFAFREELGDLLMQVLIHAEITREEGAFDIYDVAHALNTKLITRHPHVFGENKAKDADAAIQSWEKQKAKEKTAKEASILDGVPKGLPALQKAARVIEKATKVGFQWKDLEGPLDKVDEELRELKAEIESGDKKKIENELGDLLFSLCNLAYMMKVTPEDALRSTLARFESRFRHVERKLKEQGKTPEQSTLEEMDEFWNEAKRHEKGKFE